MVKIKHEMLKWAIKNQKMRIKHHEKHGRGKVAIEDKRILQLMERQQQELNK